MHKLPTSLMHLRKVTADDLSQIKKMLVETVQTICSGDYSPEQINVWISSVENEQRWINILSNQYFVLTEKEGQLTGFASMDRTGYIDLLYVHKDFQKRGIADRLYRELKEKAISSTLTALRTHASITARVFFEKKGFVVIQENRKILEGIEIINYEMTKGLEQ